MSVIMKITLCSKIVILVKIITLWICHSSTCLLTLLVLKWKQFCNVAVSLVLLFLFLTHRFETIIKYKWQNSQDRWGWKLTLLSFCSAVCLPINAKHIHIIFNPLDSTFHTGMNVIVISSFLVLLGSPIFPQILIAKWKWECHTCVHQQDEWLVCASWKVQV